MKKTGFLRKLWYGLSPNQRFTIRKIYYLPSDLWQKTQGKKHKYVPSKGAIYTGSPADSEEYIAQGLFQLETLKNHIALNEDHTVLDVGSGIGRTAIALTTFLTENGKYEGFDVVKRGIDWCNKTIGHDYSNFNFTYVPLFNNLYNTHQLKATEFTFPYADNHFDRVFSFSVFTHMGIHEIQHYFSEINRVLKPNGKCLSTFFIYDEDTESYIASKKGFSFPFEYDGYRLMHYKVQAGNIAIHKEKLKGMVAALNMKIDAIFDGFWKFGKKQSESQEYQDIVIFSPRQ